MAHQYKPLRGVRKKSSFLFITDFTIQESNKIITNVVERITKSEQRKIIADYDITTTNNGDRITRARVNSEDGVIQGVIIYDPPFSYGEEGISAEIKAEINFKPENGLLAIGEYQELYGIIQAM